jgi:hypothetical protein
MFKFVKSMSWDLWCAAPFVAKLAFGSDVVSEFEPDVPFAGGVGPGLNVSVQRENYFVGLLCWLLYATGAVKNKRVFADFDT